MQHYQSFLIVDRCGAYGVMLLQKAPRRFMLSAMILRPKPSVGRRAQPLGNQPSPPMALVPSWLRGAVEAARTLEDAAVAAGAAIGALDAVVRRHERWAGAWRQRLALASAAASARRAGRVEDEAALRDAVLLTRSGDDVGPAGRILLAWRSLVSRPAESLLSKDHLEAAIGAFGFADADQKAADLAGEVGRIALSGKAAFAAAFEVLQLLKGYGRGFDRELGPWLADAVVAHALGWSHAVPLLGASGSRSMEWVGGEAANHEVSRQLLLAGCGRAALQAIDLSADLGRRADRLLTITPKLRAKGADAIVEKLLDDDALTASQPAAGMSDRGLRRLFERLNDLGAVRELSGRATFRLYGL